MWFSINNNVQTQQFTLNLLSFSSQFDVALQHYTPDAIGSPQEDRHLGGPL